MKSQRKLSQPQTTFKFHEHYQKKFFGFKARRRSKSLDTNKLFLDLDKIAIAGSTIQQNELLLLDQSNKTPQYCCQKSSSLRDILFERDLTK